MCYDWPLGWGGFLGRKSNGEPGVKTIWLGMKEVYVADLKCGQFTRTAVSH